MLARTHKMYKRAMCNAGVYCKISNFFELRKRRAVEFGAEVGDAYTSKHQKKRDEAARTIRLAYANVLAGILEGNSPPLLGPYLCSC